MEIRGAINKSKIKQLVSSKYSWGNKRAFYDAVFCKTEIDIEDSFRHIFAPNPRHKNFSVTILWAISKGLDVPMNELIIE